MNGHRRGFLLCSLLTIALLAGCASSETRSLVSAADLPASRYSRVAVFIENVDEPERAVAEQIVLSALNNAGVKAVSGHDFLRQQAPKLTEQQKARLAQKEFEALLYVTVVERGQGEQRVENAWFDGNMIQFNLLGIATVGHNVTDGYIIKSDGSVYHPMLVLKTQSQLQDTKSAKVVWQGETISSGHANASNMNLLFTHASQQMIEKMRTDSAV